MQIILFLFCALFVAVCVKMCDEYIIRQDRKELQREQFIDNCKFIISDIACTTDNIKLNKLHSRHSKGLLHRYLVGNGNKLFDLDLFDIVSVVNYSRYFIYDTADKKLVTYDELLNMVG